MSKRISGYEEDEKDGDDDKNNYKSEENEKDEETTSKSRRKRTSYSQPKTIKNQFNQLAQLYFNGVAVGFNIFMETALSSSNSRLSRLTNQDFVSLIQNLEESQNPPQQSQDVIFRIQSSSSHEEKEEMNNLTTTKLNEVILPFESSLTNNDNMNIRNKRDVDGGKEMSRFVSSFRDSGTLIAHMLDTLSIFVRCSLNSPTCPVLVAQLFLLSLQTKELVSSSKTQGSQDSLVVRRSILHALLSCISVIPPNLLLDYLGEMIPSTIEYVEGIVKSGDEDEQCRMMASVFLSSLYHMIHKK